ncbi:MAG TPA: carboxypeptidase-like regulatory domain-containing protein, partial [Thermoanaerobaculia bacterium]|nr:carboxypeptidase-like regulatory domain-containing protein [Thermoanaerobaculia bacterium]
MKPLFLAAFLLASTAEAGSLWHPLRLSLPGLDGAPALSYTGRVLDWATGRPVAGARVWPGDDPEASVTTDARGVYRLDWAPAVPGQLWVRKEGYLPFRTVFQPPTPWIASPQAPTLAVWPARTLAGTVMRLDGRAVSGAEVRVFGRDSNKPKELAKTLSSDQGRFELAVINDGDYEVIAVSPGLAPASESLTLVEGQAGISGLRLVLRQGRTAFGRVVDEHGGPMAEARVALTRNTDDRLWPGGSADDGLFQATTDSGGRFEIPDLPAGWFDLETSRAGFLPERFQALEVEGGSGRIDLGTITLRQPATVTGWVIGSKGEPLADVRVLLKSGGEVGVEVASGPDGRFELTAPDPRKPFELEACRPDRLSLFYPYETLPDGPVEITLPSAARLTGRVVDPDGEPASGASVTASVDPDHFWPIPPSPLSCPRIDEVKATTDAEGRFVLGPLPNARLYVWATMQGYVGSDVEIVELDGTEAEVPVLALEGGSVVAGRVLQADGSPAPHALVTMTGRNGYRFMKFDFADGDGRYRIDGLPTGEQTVEAQHDALGRGQRDIEIAHGENQVDITLESSEPRLARGRVVNPDGVPVPGALVEQGPVETVYTDSRGAFAIPVDDKGYDLVARKAGYAPAYLSHWATGGAREGLELRLGREASVSGRLLGFTPADIDEVRVSAIFLRFSEMQIPGRVSSDGTYHVQGLSPGEWFITADLGGRSAGATVTISPDEPEVELDLSFPDQVEVRGRVVDADGEPVEGADVRLVGPEQEYQAVSESDGEFSLKAEEGTYEILAAREGHALTHGGVVTVADEAVEGLEIRLDRATVLTGRLLGLSEED